VIIKRINITRLATW